MVLGAAGWARGVRVLLRSRGYARRKRHATERAPARTRRARLASALLEGGAEGWFWAAAGWARGVRVLLRCRGYARRKRHATEQTAAQARIFAAYAVSRRRRHHPSIPPSLQRAFVRPLECTPRWGAREACKIRAPRVRFGSRRE